ncbi:hypothetical protein QTO30_05620 [Yoonia sp. GPGPB17]|uniref:hypothetical protein n=1 Tax=Yoonia sp. GPGPB17 TaxID=3026147 RepID=UPI0030BE1D8A
MAMVKQDINDFRARVKNIQNPRNKSYYDPDLGMHIPKRVSRDKIKKKVQRDEDSFLAKFIVAMVIGAFAMMIAQVVRIRFFGLSLDGDVVMALELFMAFWAMLMLSVLLGKRGAFDRVGQIVGIAAMLVAGHNLIWRWPDQMAYIYTAEHVEQVMEATTQHSVVYRGTVYGL